MRGAAGGWHGQGRGERWPAGRQAAGGAGCLCVHPPTPCAPPPCARPPTHPPPTPVFTNSAGSTWAAGTWRDSWRRTAPYARCARSCPACARRTAPPWATRWVGGWVGTAPPLHCTAPPLWSARCMQRRASPAARARARPLLPPSPPNTPHTHPTHANQYMHIPDRERCNWLRARIETAEQAQYTLEKKLNILDRHARVCVLRVVRVCWVLRTQPALPPHSPLTHPPVQADLV